MSKTATTSIDRLGNEQLLAKAQESVGKLWLFGLGAYSLATKSGVQAFATLVKEGKAFRPKARRQIKETSAELVSSASESIDRGEELLKSRLVRPLSSLALASKRDIEQLSKLLLQLTAEVRKLTVGTGAPMASKSTPKPSAAEPVAKSTAEPTVEAPAPTASVS